MCVFVCFNLHMGNAEAVRFLNGAIGLSSCFCSLMVMQIPIYQLLGCKETCGVT